MFQPGIPVNIYGSSVENNGLGHLDSGKLTGYGNSVDIMPVRVSDIG